MGRPKPLIPYGSSTFLETILERLNLALSPEISWRGVVVSSPLEEPLSKLCQDRGWCLVLNRSPETGPLGSIRLALEGGAEGCDWLMVCLVDQPGVGVDTYRALLQSARAHPDQFLVPSFPGRRGHPVVFPRSCFTDLKEAPLDQGARWVVARHRAVRVEVETDDDQVLRDFDTPEDLLEMKEPGTRPGSVR
jgi:molybdenum cofactor cytidylyltransferase